MLELCNISKKYKDKLALNSVSLTLDNGIYGLLGPNGAGKSTLMQIIAGNLKPNSGNVKWGGKDIRELGGAYRSLLGCAPQQQGMYDAFTVRRFLAYMAALKGISKKEVQEEIARVLALVHLTEAAGRTIAACSGGMKQRVLIAQAFLGHPKLILLDEPTAGLDPKERVKLRERISSLSEDKIILISTHVVSDIASIAKEILLLKSGVVIDHAPVRALCQKYHAPELEDVYMQLFGKEGEHDSSDII